MATDTEYAEMVIHSTEGNPIVKTVRTSSGSLMILMEEDGMQISIEQKDAQAHAEALLAAVARLKSEL